VQFNFADLSESVAAAIPDLELLVSGERRFTHAELSGPDEAACSVYL